MSSTPNLNQVHYRIRTDTATVETAPTWAAAEDTGVSIAVETTFRIRFVVQNTGTASSTTPFILRVSKNAGAYTAVTTSTGATLGAQSADASTDADGASISTNRLTAGAGTWTGAASGYDETGSISTTLPNGQYLELECGLILKTAGAAAGDTFDFRIYNSSTAFTTYSQTPRITIRSLHTGTNFSEKSVYAGIATDYNAAGHTTSVVTLATGNTGAIGDLAILAYTTDNSSTLTAGAIEGLAGVADSKGNTWSQGYSANYSPGAAQSGVNAGIWYSQLTTALAAADTVTATWQVATEANRDAIAIVVKIFSVAAGKTVALEATNYATGNAGTPPSLDATTANVECLRVRVTGFESSSAQPLGSTGWYNLPGIVGNSGTPTTSQALSGEFKISTGTSDASTPVAGATLDMASVYAAFKATTAVDTEDDLLANDVKSNSSVSQPAVQQVHNPLANDVKSNSSVTQPAAVIRRDCLANDVVSASSVSTPAAVITAAPIALLANDVLSASSVTNPAVQQLQGLLANDVKSNSSVTQPAVKQLHGALANDVLSPSSVGQPAVKQLHGILANDVKSNSSVLQPSMGSVGNILANDVKSNSSVTQPTAAITRLCLANDVLSASSVSQPAMVQRRDLLANDVKSNSSVGQPAAVIGRGLLANDVVSASSVSQPAAVIQRAILANDVTSASFVSNPVVGIVGVIDARDLVSASSVTHPLVAQRQVLDAVDVTSASSVTYPAALIVRGLLANDITSASSVSVPVLHQAQAFLANDVTSASSVTVPVASEITAGQPLAEDVTSASSVSQPTLVVISGEVLPPELGGAARPYGRTLTRKRWEDLLRQLEAERREARQRAERFKAKEDRAKARKAARAASEAIAQAIKGADEAAVADHVAELTRLLEMAKEAKRVEEYMAEMAAVRREAIEMEDENDVEEILLLVA